MTRKSEQKKAQREALVNNLLTHYLIGGDKGTKKMSPMHLARIFFKAYYAEPSSQDAADGMLDPVAADSAILSLVAEDDAGRASITEGEAQLIRDAITPMLSDCVVDPPAALCDVDAPTDTTWYKAVACDEPGAGSPAPAPSKLLSPPIRLATNKRKAVEAGEAGEAAQAEAEAGEAVEAAQAEAEAVEAGEAVEAAQGRRPRAEPKRRRTTRKHKEANAEPDAITGLVDSLIKRGLAPDEASVLAHRFLGLLGQVAPSAELKSQPSWPQLVGRAFVELRRSPSDHADPELIEKLIRAISEVTRSPASAVREWIDEAIAESDQKALAFISKRLRDLRDDDDSCKELGEAIMEVLAEVAKDFGLIVDCREGLYAAYDLGYIGDAIAEMIRTGSIGTKRSANYLLGAIKHILGIDEESPLAPTAPTGTEQEQEPYLHVIDDGEEEVIVIEDDDAAEQQPMEEKEGQEEDEEGHEAEMAEYIEEVTVEAPDFDEAMFGLRDRVVVHVVSPTCVVLENIYPPTDWEPVRIGGVELLATGDSDSHVVPGSDAPKFSAWMHSNEMIRFVLKVRWCTKMGDPREPFETYTTERIWVWERSRIAVRLEELVRAAKAKAASAPCSPWR